MSEWSQSLTLKQNVEWGFLLHTTLPTSGIVTQPHYIKMSLRVLCPVRRPVTTLDCVLLKNSNWAFVAGLGPKTNFRACLWWWQGPHHIAKCWLSTQHLILFLIFCLETPRDGSGPIHFWTELPLASLSEISFPRTSACPGTQYSPTVCQVEISFSAFWHWCTNGDILAAWSAFIATWLSQQILTYFSGLS